MPKLMHDLHAFNETNDTIIFFGGSLKNEVYRYDTAANSITQITNLAVNVENAGSYYDGNQQLYVFGGENDPDQILIHPSTHQTAMTSPKSCASTCNLVN